MNTKKVFLYLFIASISVSALIGIGVILLGDFGDIEVRVLFTTLTITVTSILGLACGAYLETKKGKLLPLAGIIFSVISAVLWLIVLWYRGMPDKWFMRTTLTVTILAVACSHLSLLSLAQLEKKFVWAHHVAHLLIWSLTAFVIFLVWAAPKDHEQVIGRTMGVLAILVAAITIVTPVFHRLSAPETAAAIDTEIRSLKLRIEELEAKRAAIAGVTEPK